MALDPNVFQSAAMSAMERATQAQRQAQETAQVLSFCVQIVCNRDKLILDQHEPSQRSVLILDNAERVVLAYLKGVKTQEAEADK
jgi:hypothetical protein